MLSCFGPSRVSCDFDLILTKIGDLSEFPPLAGSHAPTPCARPNMSNPGLIPGVPSKSYGYDQTSGMIERARGTNAQVWIDSTGEDTVTDMGNSRPSGTVGSQVVR